ncbi:MAG: hypothetical protein Q4B31_04340, partial [Clostridia bacterium]|nr:hypothetical protein [Clostridia bacterium]
ATAAPTTAPTAAPTTAPSDEPSLTPEDYLELNDDMLTHLKAVSADIEKNKFEFPVAGKMRKMILIIKDAIDDTIADGNKVIITADYVSTTYSDEIAEAKGYYDDIQANSDWESQFNEALACLNTDTIVWLATEFGLI